MIEVVFLPEAEEEMLGAAFYYQAQAPGLGARFLSEVKRAVKSITEFPNTWPIIEDDLRKKLQLSKKLPKCIVKTWHSLSISQ